MRAKPLALFFLGIALFLLIVYCGLNAAERGLRELLALEEHELAFSFGMEEGSLVIFFAGKGCRIPYASYLKGLKELMENF